MPQSTHKSSRPLSPESYRAAARKLRSIADKLDERCEPMSPREQASLTSAIHGLSLFGQALSRRHRGQSVGEAESIISAHMAALGAKGGSVTGASKARDPEAMRRAGAKSWDSRRTKT